MIIVTGLPRSGTSMMMQILKAGGLKIRTDNKRKPDEHNPKGYYEIDHISKHINEYSSGVIKLLSPYLRKIKDFSKYTIIFMERRLMEVWLSQRKMIKGSKPTFASHLADIYTFLKDKNVIYVDYNEVIKNPKKELKKIKHLVPDFKKAVEAVDEKLYRTKT